MTRKRFIKLAMSKGWSRNLACAVCAMRRPDQSYESLWFWDGPDSTAREDLRRMVVEVFNERTGGIFSIMSRFSYLGGF